MADDPKPTLPYQSEPRQPLVVVFHRQPVSLWILVSLVLVIIVGAAAWHFWPAHETDSVDVVSYQLQHPDKK